MAYLIYAGQITTATGGKGGRLITGFATEAAAIEAADALDPPAAIEGTAPFIHVGLAHAEFPGMVGGPTYERDLS